jgi:predicted kinase
MWCAYVFTGIALISLPAAWSGGSSTFIPWLAQTFLQLVLLSIIIVGQNLQASVSEQRAIETHDTVMEEFSLVKEAHAQLHEKVDTIIDATVTDTEN